MDLLADAESLYASADRRAALDQEILGGDKAAVARKFYYCLWKKLREDKFIPRQDAERLFTHLTEIIGENFELMVTYGGSKTQP